jgi:hypothetical protein
MMRVKNGLVLIVRYIVDLPNIKKSAFFVFELVGNIRIRVSNGTGQCNFLEQRDRSSFIVPEQRDNGTSSKSCLGTGRAETAYQILRRDTGRDNHYFSVKIRDGTRDGMGRDAGWNRTTPFFPMIFCFRTSFPVSEHTFPVLEHPFLF